MSCRIAIISGVGVRKYYEKIGYSLRGVGNFMVKDIPGEDFLPRGLPDVAESAAASVADEDLVT